MIVEPIPISNIITKKNLYDLLCLKRIRKLCLHHWIYWKFTSCTKPHRVCIKCRKKQQNSEVLPHISNSRWIKEKHFN